MAKRITLDQWIRSALTDEDKEGACTTMSLVHKQGVADLEVHSVRFGAKNTDPKALADLFQAKADAYSQDLTGVQTFNLLAFYGNRTSPEARHPFLVTSQTDYQGLATEPPDERGKTMQGMRLTEAIVQGTFRQTSVVFQATQMMIENLLKQNTVLMAENREYFEITKNALVEQAKREHSFEMSRLEYERSSGERRKWLSMLPALANTIFGREVFPQNTADTALLEAAVDNLTAEQAQKLAASLPPEIVGPLMQRLAQIHEKKELEAERARVAALSRMNQNGAMVKAEGVVE
jgi:hypothetical protein